MISPVTNLDPIAFLDKVTGKTPASPPPAPTPESNAVSLSSSLVALLQQTNSTSANGNSLSSLYGNNSNDPLAGVYNTLAYNKSTVAPLQDAIKALQQQQANATAQQSQVQDVLAARNKATNAYNTTLINNAKAAVTANNGVIPSA